VHRRELLGQACTRLDALGVAHERIAPAWPWEPLLVQVGSVQTVARRLDKLARLGWAPDLVVIDDAHHAIPGSTWGAVLDAWPRAGRLGVSATPARLDGVGLGVEVGGYFDALVPGPSVTRLVAEGFLAPSELYVPGRLVNTAGVAVRCGDFVRAELAAVTNKPSITGDAIEHYRALAPGQPALVFCCSIEHAADVAEAFCSAGFAAASVDGRMPAAERTRRLTDFSRGALRVLTSCELLGEGVDVPAAAVAILLRHTLSETLHLKQIGRVLRPHPDKIAALILDHAGNVLRHGPPERPREWSLLGRAAREPIHEELAAPVRRKARGGGERIPATADDSPLVAAEVDRYGGLRPSDRQLTWDLDRLRSLEVGRAYPPGWAEALYGVAA